MMDVNPYDDDGDDVNNSDQCLSLLEQMDQLLYDVRLRIDNSENHDGDNYDDDIGGGSSSQYDDADVQYLTQCQFHVQYRLAYMYFQLNENDSCIESCEDAISSLSLLSSPPSLSPVSSLPLSPSFDLNAMTGTRTGTGTAGTTKESPNESRDNHHHQYDMMMMMNRLYSLQAQAYCSRALPGDVDKAIQNFTLLIGQQQQYVSKYHHHRSSHVDKKNKKSGVGRKKNGNSRKKDVVDETSAVPTMTTMTMDDAHRDEELRVWFRDLLFQRCVAYVELNQLDDAMRDVCELLECYDPLYMKALLLKARILYMISQSMEFYSMDNSSSLPSSPLVSSSPSSSSSSSLPLTEKYYLDLAKDIAHTILQIIIVREGDASEQAQQPSSLHSDSDMSDETSDDNEMHEMSIIKKEVLLLLANCYSKLHMHQHAIDACQLLLLTSSEPHDIAIGNDDYAEDDEYFWDAMTIRASCHFHLYQYDKSIHDYDMIESHDPSTVLEHGDEYGYMLARLARYRALFTFADRYFNQVKLRNEHSRYSTSDLSHHPLEMSHEQQQILKHNVQMEILYGIGQYKQGLTYYDKFVKPLENDIEPSLLLSLRLIKIAFMMRLKQFDQALSMIDHHIHPLAQQYYNEMISINMLRYRAVIWAELGEYGKSTAEWNRLLLQIQQDNDQEDDHDAIVGPEDHEDNDTIAIQIPTPVPTNNRQLSVSELVSFIEIRQSQAVILATKAEAVSQALKQLDALVKEALRYSLIDCAVDVLVDMVTIEITNRRFIKAQRHIARILEMVPEHSIRKWIKPTDQRPTRK